MWLEQIDQKFSQKENLRRQRVLQMHVVNSRRELYLEKSALRRPLHERTRRGALRKTVVRVVHCIHLYVQKIDYDAVQVVITSHRRASR